MKIVEFDWIFIFCKVWEKMHWKANLFDSNFSVLEWIEKRKLQNLIEFLFWKQRRFRGLIYSISISTGSIFDWKSKRANFLLSCKFFFSKEDDRIGWKGWGVFVRGIIARRGFRIPYISKLICKLAVTVNSCARWFNGTLI